MPRLITIFIVLGLAFLIGGVGAIVDGWPYLMIERGFTQVIIGTVGATGGVILLALSRVLAELRRVRTALSAMTLLSAAALPGEVEPRVRREERPAPALEPAPAETDRAGMLGPAVAGAGLAAAGGTFAAALAHDAATRESEAEPANETPPPLPPMVPPVLPSMLPPVLPAMRAPDEEKPEPGTADLFDDTPAVADEAAGVASEPHEDDEPPQKAAELEDEPEAELPLAAQPASGEAEPEEESEDASAAVPDDRLDGPAEPEATHDLPQDASQPAEPAPSMWWPRIDTPRAPAEPERAATDFDDLASLRDHLTRGPQAPGDSAEADTGSEEKAPDSDIAAAESWMEPAFGRREPTFAEPADEPAAPAEEEPVEQPAVADDELSAEQPEADTPEEPAASEQEPAADAPAPEETPRPAASDEGVVGAYQVGDTHFTMFADGSIRARTPEGEYSFASMEELKAYLASEKSRLGV